MASRKKAVPSPTLVYEGALTIERAADVRLELIRTLDACGAAVVQLDRVNDIDTTIFQLFCSAHRTAVTTGKRFELAGRAPESMRAIAKDIGPCEYCDAVKGPCFWKGGADDE